MYLNNTKTRLESIRRDFRLDQRTGLDILLTAQIAGRTSSWISRIGVSIVFPVAIAPICIVMPITVIPIHQGVVPSAECFMCRFAQESYDEDGEKSRFGRQDAVLRAQFSLAVVIEVVVLHHACRSEMFTSSSRRCDVGYNVA